MSRRMRAAFTKSGSDLTGVFSRSDTAWRRVEDRKDRGCIIKMILPREDAIRFMQLVPLKVTR
jgi:hypothetical protein